MTVASISISRISDRTRCSATTATERSPTCRGRAERMTRGFPFPLRSSTTIATDGWISTSATIWTTASRHNETCFRVSGERDYCPPTAYRPQPDRLYHNNRDGTFTDVTAKALAGGEYGPALGVTTADFNGDGWPDIYVANDNQDNLLWMNQRDGTFRNTALLSGVALTAEGKAEASMGVDAGDFDNDGDEDLFMTELTGEGSNLYVNDGTAVFEDQSARSGLGPAQPRVYRLRDCLVRFRQRRLARHPDGQRNDRGHRGASPNATIRFRCTSGNSCSAISATGSSRTSPIAPARRSGCRKSAAAPPSAISTTTATWTCWSGNDAGRTRLLINNIGSRKHWLGLRLAR